MIDHVLVYPSEGAREAAWPAPVDGEGNPIGAPSWSVEGRHILPAKIVHARATFTKTGKVKAAEKTEDGAWISIRTADRDTEIEAMDETVLVIDAERAAEGEKYVIKCTLDPETIIGQIEPIWAGSDYALPVGEPASSLNVWRIG